MSWLGGSDIRLRMRVPPSDPPWHRNSHFYTTQFLLHIGIVHTGWYRTWSDSPLAVGIFFYCVTWCRWKSPKSLPTSWKFVSEKFPFWRTRKGGHGKLNLLQFVHFINLTTPPSPPGRSPLAASLWWEHLEPLSGVSPFLLFCSCCIAHGYLEERVISSLSVA